MLLAVVGNGATFHFLDNGTIGDAVFKVDTDARKVAWHVCIEMVSPARVESLYAYMGRTVVLEARLDSAPPSA